MQDYLAGTFRKTHLWQAISILKKMRQVSVAVKFARVSLSGGILRAVPIPLLVYGPRFEFCLPLRRLLSYSATVVSSLSIIVLIKGHWP